jgi:CheY-like chemotaxis protein
VRVLIVDEALGAAEIGRLRRGLTRLGGADAPALILLTAERVGPAPGEAMGVEVSGRVRKPVELVPLGLAVTDALGVGAAHPSAARADPLPRGRSLRVLLAEDNPVNQQVVVDMLEDLGCHVAIVGDGVEVLEAVARAPYDLILMDCLMPRVDGFDATREIRRREAASGAPRRPIIALTALSAEGDRQRCIAAGMDDFLAKPFRRRELLQVLERWRGRSHPE